MPRSTVFWMSSGPLLPIGFPREGTIAKQPSRAIKVGHQKTPFAKQPFSKVGHRKPAFAKQPSQPSQAVVAVAVVQWLGGGTPSSSSSTTTQTTDNNKTNHHNNVCDLPGVLQTSCGRPPEVFGDLPEVFRRSSGGRPEIFPRLPKVFWMSSGRLQPFDFPRKATGAKQPL